LVVEEEINDKRIKDEVTATAKGDFIILVVEVQRVVWG
jgi:hypothetical protein